MGNCSRNSTLNGSCYFVLISTMQLEVRLRNFRRRTDRVQKKRRTWCTRSIRLLRTRKSKRRLISVLSHFDLNLKCHPRHIRSFFVVTIVWWLWTLKEPPLSMVFIWGNWFCVSNTVSQSDSLYLRISIQSCSGPSRNLRSYFTSNNT